MVCLKNLSVDTLHKGETKDNNNNEYCAKESGKEVKIQEFMYRDKTNVEPEMYDCTSNIWSQWNSKEKLKEKFGSYIRKTFDRFTKKTAILGTSHIIRKVLQCEA
jgi:hypothetical protein